MATAVETRTKLAWDYAPAPESADHVRLRESYGLFIGGEFRDPLDGGRVPSVNPASEQPIAAMMSIRPTTDCALRIADCGLLNADCGLRVADSSLRIAECGSQIAD